MMILNVVMICLLKGCINKRGNLNVYLVHAYYICFNWDPNEETLCVSGHPVNI